MKILCFGAGAIGSYIAGSLALIGNPLIYVEQPQYIANLKENGVRIEDMVLVTKEGCLNLVNLPKELIEL